MAPGAVAGMFERLRSATTTLRTPSGPVEVATKRPESMTFAGSVNDDTV